MKCPTCGYDPDDIQQKRAAVSRWSGMTKKERSEEMSRVRKKGIKKPKLTHGSNEHELTMNSQNEATKLPGEPAVVSSALVRRPRGCIKRFREHLNALDVGDSKHRHLLYRQRTRKYGDYLYHQDRERFMVELDEWIKPPNAEPSGGRPRGASTA